MKQQEKEISIILLAHHNIETIYTYHASALVQFFITKVPKTGFIFYIK